MDIINKVVRAVGFLPLVLLVLMMLLVVGDVLSRFSLNQPITGAQELTRIIMVFMLLSLPLCVIERRHVRVDLLTKRFPIMAQRILDIINAILTFCICAILGWKGYESALYAKKVNLNFSVLNISHFYFMMLLAVSFFIFCLALVGYIVRLIMEAGKNES